MNTAERRPLARQRCYQHATREAVARCVSCGRPYCRECVAEHAGRMICATCLRREQAAPAKRTSTWPRALARSALTVLAALLAWACFYAAADFLVQIPADVHAGTAWSDE